MCGGGGLRGHCSTKKSLIVLGVAKLVLVLFLLFLKLGGGGGAKYLMYVYF